MVSKREIGMHVPISRLLTIFKRQFSIVPKNGFLILNALVSTFNKENALDGPSPGTVKLRESSLTALVNTGARPCIHRDHSVSDPTSPIVQGKLFTHQLSTGDVLTHSSGWF